jgi:hypothetical protein
MAGSTASRVPDRGRPDRWTRVGALPRRVPSRNRPQSPDFAQATVRFADTGAVTQPLKTQLRITARSGICPGRLLAHRLIQYCEPGPAGENFAAACGQIDRTDAMLDGFRQKARGALAHPRQACPDVDGPWTAVLASQEHETQTVALVLDATSVSVAIATHTDEREARIREVEQISRSLSEGSSGRWNLEP